MAQLSDDCFAFGGALLGVDEALARIDARVVAVVDSEMVPLGAAAGRVLAHDLVAKMDLPPHANSAVDGYAVAHADLSPDFETDLPVGGRAAAGHPLDRAMRRGEAIRIFTGAPMPEGADTVLMQEDCAAVDGRVRLKPGIRKGANRRRAAEDVAATDLGQWLPSRIGRPAGGGGERERAMRTLGVVVSDVGAHGPFEMATSGEQEVVQAVFTGGAYPSLGERVCLGGADPSTCVR